jgi:hypothetical protein
MHTNRAGKVRFRWQEREVEELYEFLRHSIYAIYSPLFPYCHGMRSGVDSLLLSLSGLDGFSSSLPERAIRSRIRFHAYSISERKEDSSAPQDNSHRIRSSR